MQSALDDDGVLPLEDIQVVDLTQVLAGPFGTMTLGDMGAEVIKIEAVGRGDRSRGIQPSPEYFDTINRNKRSITLNLKDERGQEIALDILSNADIFIESTKPGRIERYGLGYDAVQEVNPNIIYCSITGFGEESPYEDLPAWDMLIQAMSGIMSITGKPDGPPLWSGLPSGDLIASMYAVQSVLAALYAQEREALNGEWIQVPMLDAAISWLTSRAGYTFGFDEPFPRLGTHHPSIAPFGLFDCANGRLVIAAGTDSLWQELCDALELDEIQKDPRFQSMESRVEHQDELVKRLESVLAKYEKDELLDRLHHHDIPAGSVYNTKTLWEDEHIQKRNLRQSMPRTGREDAEVIDHPVHFNDLVTELRTAPEELGESTDDILSELGYSADKVKLLRNADVID